MDKSGEESKKHTMVEMLASKSLQPLVKWSGGKGREIDHFSSYYPKDFTTYVEPFVGGGAVFFDLNSPKNVIADVHQELINFYVQVKGGAANRIYDMVTSYPADETGYYFVRDKLDHSDPVVSAARFFYLRKTAFRGMLRYNSHGKFNIPWGRYKNVSFESILNPAYTALLQATDVHLCPFGEIFEMYNDENNFMFLDPPYDSTFTNYGYCEFGKAEHIDLANRFKSTKNKCMMVIGKTQLIEELYKGYIVDSYHKRYGFRIHSGRVGSEIDTDHLIIINY